jgi:hypothetical protein
MRKVYTFIRKDLPINHQIVQACHSALEAGSEFKKPGNIPFLILLESKNQDHLFEVKELLDKNGIKHHMFFEPDNGIGHSSITTEPLTLDQSRLLSNFRLWRAE